MLSPSEVVLFVIYCSNGVISGITRLQKIIFLLQREMGLGNFIFKPYQFGPFSMEVKYVVQSLENQGFLKVEEGSEFSPLQEHPIKIIRLTSQGLCEAEKIMGKLDEKTFLKAQILVRYLNRVPLTYLIAYIC
ncbi:MAG: hypothetical protein QXI93_02520 [Candidatus Methanomethylicia archaeon]